MNHNERTSGVSFPEALVESPAVEKASVSYSLFFDGATDRMPIVDDQLFLCAPPQGGLIISPQCVGTPLLVIWKSGADWLVQRLCQSPLLYNGFETMGDAPILLQNGVRLELVGVSAFTFLEVMEQPSAVPVTETAPEPEISEEPVPAQEPEINEEPVPEEAPEVIEETVPAEEAAATAEEPAFVWAPAPSEEPAFDWAPFLPEEPEAPAQEPEAAEEPASEEEPEVVKEAAPVEEAAVPEEEPAFVWAPVPSEEPAFDWAPFLPEEPEVPAQEPETAEEPVPEEVPEVIEEAVSVEEAAAPEEEPVPAQEPPVEEIPVQPEPVSPREALVLALEQLASGDWEALQRIPGLLEQVDLYCWGGFNFQGIYLQPIPGVRGADWSGDADSLDQLGWEPRPGMVIPVFTCEAEAVKRSCPLGAFPSCSAAGLFARFAEMGLDLEVDPFGERPVWVPAGAVRALSEALGGGVEKFRWIRRTLPW